MGILFIVQTYTGFSLSWVTPETVSTIIGLITPVLVWAIPNLLMSWQEGVAVAWCSSASGLGHSSWHSGSPQGSSSGRGLGGCCCLGLKRISPDAC